jgi:hypothetical protein
MQVTVTIKTIEQKFPGGTVGGDFRIELSPASDPATIAFEYSGPNASANFDLPDNDPPDTYVVRGMRLDAGDAVIGPIATTQFTVGEDLVPLDVAASISVVSSPGTRAAATSSGGKHQR